MKLWIARNKSGKLFIYEQKLQKYSDELNSRIGYWEHIIDSDEFPEITFENSPQEIELKLSNPISKQLTRDYFAKHNWEIITHEPNEYGFVLWEARWVRRMEEGSPYYSDISVTNMMHEERFCVSGKTGEASVEYLMAYTEDDLINILKVLDIYDYYKKES